MYSDETPNLMSINKFYLPKPIENQDYYLKSVAEHQSSYLNVINKVKIFLKKKLRKITTNAKRQQLIDKGATFINKKRVKEKIYDQCLEEEDKKEGSGDRRGKILRFASGIGIWIGLGF